MRDSSWVKRERNARRADRLPARRHPARQDRRSAEGGLNEDRPAMTVLTAETGRSGRAGNFPRGRIPRRVCPRLEAGRGALERRQPVDAVPGSALARCVVRRVCRAMTRRRAADRHHLGCGDRRAGGAVAADPPPAERHPDRRIRRSRSDRLQRAAARRAAPRDAQAARADVARSAGGAAAAARRRRSHSPAQDAGRSRRPAQSAGAARWRGALCAQRQSGHHRRRFRRLALFAGAHRAQGTGAELARVYARSGRGVQDRHRQDRSAARPRHHGGPAGRADAASRAELHSQRRDLRRVLSQSGRRQSSAAAMPCCRR